MNTFYMVYLEGGNSPEFKHRTLEDAEQEAKRLSKLLKKRAYILVTVKSFELNEFKIEDCRPDADLPF